MKIINSHQPSQWTSNDEVDQIALEYNLLYREKCGKQGISINVEHFADLVLEISVEQSRLEVIPGAIALARCKPDPRDTSTFVIQFNEDHQKYFDENPTARRTVGSHEVGHIVLRHHDKMIQFQTPSLFDDFKPEPKFLHKTLWKHHSFSADDLKNLCEMALQGNEKVRKILKNFDDHCEEEWMFWQAEHFAMCFLIPKDAILQILNSGYDVTSWKSIYSLGDEFGVPGSMMATRLKKLKAIEIHDKQISLGGLLKQPNLL